MSKSDILKAYEYSSRHRALLEQGDTCGCFDCLAIFPSAEITEWIDEGSGTAVCPYCYNDTVIGESSGFPITKDFLQRMKNHWCPE